MKGVESEVKGEGLGVGCVCCCCCCWDTAVIRGEGEVIGRGGEPTDETPERRGEREEREKEREREREGEGERSREIILFLTKVYAVCARLLMVFIAVSSRRATFKKLKDYYVPIACTIIMYLCWS